MKRLLIILLFIPCLAFGQMRVESHKQELFKGVRLNYKVYYSPTPTNNWVLFLHGSGEGGLPDGSQLDKVDANGLPKNAKYGAVYNFNILAAQAYKLPGDAISRFESIRWVIIDLVKEYYKADRLIVTGLSQGGMEALDFGFRDPKGYIDAIIVMCGKTSWSKDIPRDTVYTTDGAKAILAWSKYRDIPYCAVHGTADKAPSGVNYSDGYNAYKAILSSSLNKSRNKTIFLPIIGGGHSSAWVKGYDKNDPTGIGKRVFEFIDEVFYRPPIACTALLDTIKMNAQFLLPTGRVYKAAITKQ
jgi:predicted peptidase